MSILRRAGAVAILAIVGLSPLVLSHQSDRAHDNAARFICFDIPENNPIIGGCIPVPLP